jgi:hypothetical protein
MNACEPVWAAIVPIDGPAYLTRMEQTVAAIRDAIGTPMMERTLIADDVTAWVDDADYLPANTRVTSERDRIRQAPGEKPLRGTVVLLGLPDRRTGYETDLPERWLTDLKPGGRLGWTSQN